MPLVDWYRRNRARSAALFNLLDDEAYYSRPIALRQPVVFYEGHLPAFSFNTLVKRGLGRPSIDAGLEALFARGIDPEETAASAQASSQEQWPTREQVQARTHVVFRLKPLQMKPAVHVHDFSRAERQQFLRNG